VIRLWTRSSATSKVYGVERVFCADLASVRSLGGINQGIAPRAFALAHSRRLCTSMIKTPIASPSDAAWISNIKRIDDEVDTLWV
jgi:hypothetical protein